MSAWGADDPVDWASRKLGDCGVESPRLEAQLLLALALGISRSAVTAGLYGPIDDSRRAQFQGLVEARCHRTPLAYLRGSQEFYGLDFEVGPAVLIPRPETEMLVDFGLDCLRANAASISREPCLADVGIGSGCIAISVLANYSQATGVGFEISSPAIDVARTNAFRHGVAARLTMMRSDLMTGVAASRFDLILSNPPYIARGELESLQPEVRDAEPRLALDGGVDGLDPYRRFAPQAMRSLVPGGFLAVEVGQGQAREVAELFHRAGLRGVEIRKDLASIERLVAARRPR